MIFRHLFILLLLLLTCSSGPLFAAERITIIGSDTLVRLGQRWAQEYMQQQPDVLIQVSGGGTGTGIASLLNGTTDICEASRDMQPGEYKLARERGVDPYRVPVARDGIAVFVHAGNPVREFTLADLKDIYTGAVTNWAAFGGPDHRIIPYGRNNNSGTYAVFQQVALGGADYADFVQSLPGTAGVVNAVSKDPYGIGYGSIAWVRDVQFASIKVNDTAPALLPTIENILADDYPLSRDLYWFFNGQPTGALATLVTWVLSPAGQALALSTDYVPMAYPYRADSARVKP